MRARLGDSGMATARPADVPQWVCTRERAKAGVGGETGWWIGPAHAVYQGTRDGDLEGRGGISSSAAAARRDVCTVR